MGLKGNEENWLKRTRRMTLKHRKKSSEMRMIGNSTLYDLFFEYNAYHG